MELTVLITEEQVNKIRVIDFQLDTYPEKTISLDSKNVSYVALKILDDDNPSLNVLFWDGSFRMVTPNDIEMMYMQIDKHCICKSIHVI